MERHFGRRPAGHSSASCCLYKRRKSSCVPEPGARSPAKGAWAATQKIPVLNYPGHSLIRFPRPFANPLSLEKSPPPRPQLPTFLRSWQPAKKLDSVSTGGPQSWLRQECELRPWGWDAQENSGEGGSCSGRDQTPKQMHPWGWVLRVETSSQKFSGISHATIISGVSTMCQPPGTEMSMPAKPPQMCRGDQPRATAWGGGLCPACSHSGNIGALVFMGCFLYTRRHARYNTCYPI